MGIAPYKTFTFDGVSSSAYGVYLTGEGVFNAPERDVEMIEVYGRNGDFALDHGRFRNITVTYRAGIFDATESNFADKVSAVRNWLCSKVGYCRLEDEYNPNEYRMAVYSSGLNVEHDFLIAGEFEITFTCKPQRWLTSGETKTTLVSGNTITNPTLYDASPQFQVYGYGDISIGAETISVINSVIGEVIIANSGNIKNIYTKSFTFDDALANTGDTISVGSIFVGRGWFIDEQTYPQCTIQSITPTVTGNGTASGTSVIDVAKVTATMNAETFSVGTSSTKTVSVSYLFAVKEVGEPDWTTTGTITISLAYNGTDTITLTCNETIPNEFLSGSYDTGVRLFISWETIKVDSTKSVLGSPLYIDLDIGEAWNEDFGTPVSVNDAVVLPPNLPVLPSGATAITFDNTFTKVDIVPRWWKV